MISQTFKKIQARQLTLLLRHNASYRENPKYQIPVFGDLTDIYLPPPAEKDSTQMFYKESDLRKYLSPYNQFQQTIEGKMEGGFIRPLICLPVANLRVKKYLAVYFIIDTTSPITFLEERAVKALEDLDDTKKGLLGQINLWGIREYFYRSRENYSHVNILGANFFKKGEVKIQLSYNQDYQKRKVLLRKFKSDLL